MNANNAQIARLINELVEANVQYERFHTQESEPTTYEVYWRGEINRLTEALKFLHDIDLKNA